MSAIVIGFVTGKYITNAEGFKKTVYVLSPPTILKTQIFEEMYNLCNRNKLYEAQMFHGGSKFHSVQ